MPPPQPVDLYNCSLAGQVASVSDVWMDGRRGRTGLPKARHLAWPGRPDRDLTGRQAGIHPLIIINY